MEVHELIGGQTAGRRRDDERGRVEGVVTSMDDVVMFCMYHLRPTPTTPHYTAPHYTAPHPGQHVIVAVYDLRTLGTQPAQPPFLEYLHMYHTRVRIYSADGTCQST